MLADARLASDHACAARTRRARRRYVMHSPLALVREPSARSVEIHGSTPTATVPGVAETVALTAASVKAAAAAETVAVAASATQTTGVETAVVDAAAVETVV